MCDPLTIASAAASVIGNEMQMSAQRKAQKGIESAIRVNGEANDRLRDQSRQGVMTQADNFSREKFDANQAEQTQKVKELFDKTTSQGVLPGEYYGGRQSENTKNASVREDNKATSFTQQMSDALANLRGFDQGQGVNTRGVQRAGEVVAMNQNKEAGNNAVLPLQIEAAKQKGQSPLGDIFVGLGQAGLTAGLSAPAGASAPISLSQGSLSRTLAGTPYGPVNGFAGTGFNLS